MSEETITGLDRFPAPYSKSVELYHVEYDNGFAMLRVRIREGKRFTTMDLDLDTAEHWARVMADWVEAQRAGGNRE